MTFFVIAGTVLVTLGAFKSTENTIAKQSLTFMEYNPDILTNLSKQIIEIRVGLILILASFFFQLGAQSWDFTAMGGSDLKLVEIFCSMVLLLGLGFILFRWLRKRWLQDVKKATLKWIFLYGADSLRDDRHRKLKGEITQYNSTELLARQLCNFARKNEESKEDFTIRVVKYLKIEHEVEDIMKDSVKRKNLIAWAWGSKT